MNRTVLLVAAALALATPASATWFGPGGAEPDTSFDKDPALMFPDPDRTPGDDLKQVYFNAYQVQWFANVNPNLAAMNTHQTAGIVHIKAYLGVWKDCNGDGYIGHVEHAVSEYRTELLLDDSICGIDTMFNDGDWVFEFFHIGPYNVTDKGETFPMYNTYNATARVWGDVGAPGGVVAFSCPLSPPHSSFARTGGVIRWLDCPSGKSIGKGVNALDAALPGPSFGFEDPANPQQSSSPLNVVFPVNLWGDREAGGKRGLLEHGHDRQEYRPDEPETYPAFTAWDCSEEGEVVDVREDSDAVPQNVTDPTGGSLKDVFHEIDDKDEDIDISDEDDPGHFHSVYAPSPKVHDATGSYADALNETERGALHDCKTPDGGTESELTNVANPEGELESEGQSPWGKNEAQAEFTFTDGAALAGQHRDVGTQRINYGENATFLLGANAPVFAGTTFRSAAGWSSRIIITSEEFYVTPESGPTDKRYMTFYAWLPSDFLAEVAPQLPGGGATRAYGADWCPQGITPSDGLATPDSDHYDNTGSVQQGWSCDPDNWYLSPSGTPTEDIRNDFYKNLHPKRITVGDPYHLRDVECFDGLRAKVDAGDPANPTIPSTC